MDLSRRHRYMLVGTVVILGAAVIVFMQTQLSTDTRTEAADRETGAAPPTVEMQRHTGFPLDEYASNMQSGGPGKDGIPSIDNPKFVSAAEAENMFDPGDIVFGVAKNGVVKAYPQHVLVWHEIVNDKLGDTNVAVTYCPLTGTVLGFNRGNTTFGVSGDLVNNNLVMYDRATDSRWPQILGTAVSGPLKGESLEEFNVVWTTWKQWKQKHPDTKVLSEDTGYVRNYGSDPYGGYNPRSEYYKKGSGLFPSMNTDNTFSPKHIVIGVRTTTGAAAFDKETLRRQKVMAGMAGDIHITIVYDPGLDTVYAYRNPDQRDVSYENGEVSLNGKMFEPGNLPLKQLHVFDSFWFAWTGFYPETQIYE